MQERYCRNIPAISEQEQALLTEKSIFVVGCGGLGGYIVEELARLGVGHITVADGDVFSESNLNRQLFSSMSTLGRSKVEVAGERIKDVNPGVELTAINEFLSADNLTKAISGNDLVLDALDSVADRMILEDICAKINVPLVHGAVKGWNLQVAVSMPGSNTLHNIFKTNMSDDNNKTGEETDEIKINQDNPDEKTCLCPAPAICASLQVVEALKILIGHESTLAGKLLCMDLKSMDSYTIKI